MIITSSLITKTYHISKFASGGLALIDTHGDLNHVLKSINKYQLDDMIGYRAINPKNKTEVYQLIISYRTGTVLLIKPHYMVKGNGTYIKIIKSIFGKFELDFENFEDHIAIYSLITLQKYEGDNADSYQTSFSVWDDGITHKYDMQGHFSYERKFPSEEKHQKEPNSR